VLQLSSLECLDMSRNRLRAIPSDIWKLGSLKVLSVEDNRIRGLPIVLGTMANLSTLKYDNNPIMFPLDDDVRSYQCEPDINLSMDIPDPETHRLKEYLRRHNSLQISERTPARNGKLELPSTLDAVQLILCRQPRTAYS
jgi:Leucine-rich repeat (LRR) protein